VKLVDIGEAQAGLSSLIEQSQKERIILTRHGRPVAMLLGTKDRDLEHPSLSQNAAFRDLIADRCRDERTTISHEMLAAEAARELRRARSIPSRRVRKR
jgi:prevent-host-death family protein